MFSLLKMKNYGPLVEEEENRRFALLKMKIMDLWLKKKKKKNKKKRIGYSHYVIEYENYESLVEEEE